MQEQVVHWIHAGRTAAELSGVAPEPLALPDLPPLLQDKLARPLHDLRISVTDRCNFRCTYCMPKEVFDKDFPYLPSAAMLDFDEIERVARAAVGLGVRKLRLTGGEPLLRKDVETLIARLAALRAPDGEAIELAMTTNASLLKRKAAGLRAAGLNRVTVSLDAIEDATFRRMNDVDFPVRDVLDGIEAAVAAGLGPVKVNVVVKRGVNDNQILPIVAHFRHRGVVLRFIEFMDVGATNGWQMQHVLPAAELRARIADRYELVPLEPSSSGETAQRYMLADGSLEIGTISSISEPFCGDCNRARLSTDGKLFLCLFAVKGFDIRHMLRGGVSDDELARTIAGIWTQRRDRYSELRAEVGDRRRQAKVEMSYIGG
ncbi:MAG TPA: GTP 3',8-cyclase MoaA [Noviherbaspirillum sp.]|nr:GTP 3',8-cyclase MoaA [Noviherbaspirillum sp.]